MAEKEQQQGMKRTTAVVLTHRKDLPKREVVMFVDYEPTMQTIYPGQTVTGDFVRLDDRPGSLWMKHPKLGELLVHTNKNIFKTGDKSVEALQSSKSKPVTLSLDSSGTKLFIIQEGIIAKKNLETPALPMGLIQSGVIDHGSEVTGELKGVYNKGYIFELKTKEGPFFYGQFPSTKLAQSESSARKLIGKQVGLSYGDNGALVLRGLEFEQKLPQVG